jgi:hypothetical protein
LFDLFDELSAHARSNLFWKFKLANRVTQILHRFSPLSADGAAASALTLRIEYWAAKSWFEFSGIF